MVVVRHTPRRAPSQRKAPADAERFWHWDVVPRRPKKKNWTHSYRVEKYVTLHVVHVIGLATVPGHAGGSGARAYHLGLTKHFPALAP